MTAYQLPEDVGQNAVTRNGKVVQAEGTFPSGQKAADKSIPIVLPKENFTLPIIDNYRHKTEVDRDLLGFPRQTRPYNFLTKDDQFGSSLAMQHQPSDGRTLLFIGAAVELQPAPALRASLCH